MNLLLVLLMAQTPVSEDLLANSRFEEGLSSWAADSSTSTQEVVEMDGRPVARIAVADAQPVGFPRISQDLPVQPGEAYEARVQAMGHGVRDGYGVYISCEFLNSGGNRVSFAQSSAAPGDGSWVRLAIRCAVPDGAQTLRLCLLINGRGEAFFDDARLVRLSLPGTEPVEGPVTLTVTDEVACPALIGFGAEEDGWLYNQENAAKGVKPGDLAIRESRIEWMEPDYVRMFFWYKDWNPSGDWETFTFDTDNMVSHYKSLDTYQKLGARVNVTGVEWGVEEPYADPPRTAKAIGALFEHLIRERGYTCIQDWTLTNEPNGYFQASGNSFERYVELHALMKKEFARRGLPIRIVGSDDAQGFPWFRQCVASDKYFATVDYFTSHRYFKYQDRMFAPLFFEDRFGALRERASAKPFGVAEFGFQDLRSGTFENPIMEEYDYAVWTTAFILEGLDRGTAAFCIWCLHEVYYPGGNLMNYGLWDYKDNNWNIRPVYHAISMFTRNTEAGDVVRRCSSSHPGSVLGGVIDDTLFWVNRSSRPADIVVKGFAPGKVRVMDESTLEGDRECGKVLTLEEGRFLSPPMSFGYAK